MFHMVFHLLIWIDFLYHMLTICLYHEFLSRPIRRFDMAFFEICKLQTTKNAPGANEILNDHDICRRCSSMACFMSTMVI